jgi:hypothetical protein
MLVYRYVMSTSMGKAVVDISERLVQDEKVPVSDIGASAGSVCELC